ncbi:MAG: bifunctional hydroxymethylpyrimidine kinase/phosphomethylpyrimidine kinase [Planctomycetes bacterium]|nr:bifunctional hydroxymethylpyrimidine kinase/phosphomethylpyrimidine kinase [Planctomycetota bacterium]
MTHVVLTIAGSDPSGGAGLQADLKTFHQHGVYGMSVVTLLTVQNTQSVEAVEVLAAEFVARQLDAVISDIPPQAAKTGALGNAAVVETIAAHAADFPFPLVVDPVMISKHNAALIDDDAVELLKTKLLPNTFLVTPNLPEAARLSELEVKDPASMKDAARAISQLGARNVLIKGGHLDGEPIDVLWADGEWHQFTSERANTQHTHGTGCVLSAAITARLAKGADIISAVKGAKKFVSQAIQTNPGLGHGCGPLNLFTQS